MASQLREARDAKGWTLEQAANRLLRLAARRNVSVAASQTSLRQMISDMERGRRKPGHYAPLLCELYGRTKNELGFQQHQPLLSSPEEQPEDLVGRIERSQGISTDTFVALQGQVDGIRVLDRQLGSPAVIDTTRGLVSTLHGLLEHSFKLQSRAKLAGILADAAALNAWQALNSGEIQDAWKLHELAKIAARESGSTALLVHAMGEQAYALLDLNRPNDAIDLLNSAQSIAGSSIPDLLRSWLNAASAEAHAVGQNHTACHSALTNAARILPSHPDNSETPYISLNEWHLSRWRGNILARIGDMEAVKELEQALNHVEPSFVRATSSLECDMAEALFAQDRQNEAVHHLKRAHSLASTTGTVRQLRRIRQLAQRIA